MTRPVRYLSKQSQPLHRGAAGISKINDLSAACERCRGQKLKCIRDGRNRRCRRCQRADSACIVPPPKPMGRPPRRDQNADYSIAATGNHTTRSEPETLTVSSPAILAMTADETLLPQQTTHEALGAEDDFDWLASSYALNSAFEDIFTFGGQTLPGSRDSLPNGGHTDHAVPIESLDSSVSTLTQLAELNVAISKHPLHRTNESNPRTTIVDELEPDEPRNIAPPTNNNSLADLTVAELGVGVLLGLTRQLRDVVMRLRTLDATNPPRDEMQDRSLAVMSLSCYTNLDMLIALAIETLHQIQPGARKLIDAWKLMPGLSVDGFDLASCHSVQLGFLIGLFERIQGMLRECIRVGGVKTLTSLS